VPLRVRIGGRTAIDMLAVLDREVLQIAQPRIDPAQCFVWRGFRVDASFAGEARLLRGFDDQPGEPLASPPVEAVGLGVFVDQLLQLAGVAAEIGANERRRQVADGHGREPSLRLRRFTGIADDERVEHRQRAEHRFGKT
jgi:hypothetical protein